ncbi:MAG: hypothetical protein WCN95_03535 [bacterium]
MATSGKVIHFTLAAYLLVAAAGSNLFAAGQIDSNIVNTISHPFLCSDNTQGKVFEMSATGKILWEYAAVSCQDVWKLTNGNYLLSHVHGVKEVKPDKTIVWEYKSPDGTEVHNCQPLPDGNVMICEGGSKRLMEINIKGEVVKELKVEAATRNAHMQFRAVRKLNNGHYLIALVGENMLREIDETGKSVWEFKTPGNVYIGVRLPNGNTLAGCGDGHTLIEIDKNDKIVWQVTENELPGIPLRFVAGIQRLPNGNTVICNWGGHGHIGKQPQVIEVTPDKKVVWQIADYNTFRAIAGIQLLDVPGDPAKGVLLK